jgi:2-oxoglutarate ferredoxin oxidoreductase subunit beta
VDIKIVLFNNEIYGLTKGQYSPTSRLGTRTKSSPLGSVENPIRPITVALAAEATFVARTVDVDINHLTDTLRRAALHKGSAFVEVYQNCKVFNDGVFEYLTDKEVKADHILYLEHGKPLIFGKQRNKGIRLNGLEPEVVELGKGISVDDLVIHDEKAAEPTLAFILSRMYYPQFPEPVGVFRAIERPTFEELLNRQVEDVIKAKGRGKLEELFQSDDIWVVEESEANGSAAQD